MVDATHEQSPQSAANRYWPLPWRFDVLGLILRHVDARKNRGPGPTDCA